MFSVLRGTGSVIDFTVSLNISWKSNLISSSHLRQCGQQRLLPSEFRKKLPLSQCASHIPAFHPAWINHPAVRSSKRRNFHLPPATSSLSSPITVSTLCWKTSNWPQETVMTTRQATSHAFVVDNVRYHDQTQLTPSVCHKMGTQIKLGL